MNKYIHIKPTENTTSLFLNNKQNFHIQAIKCQLENPIYKNSWQFEDNLILAGVTNCHHVTLYSRLLYSLQIET